MLSVSHLVAHQSTQSPGAFLADPPGNAAGPYLPRLRDHYVAEGRALGVVVQDILGELSALTTPCGSVNDHHGIAFYQRNNLEFEKSDLP